MNIFKLENWPPRWIFMGTPEFAVPVLKEVSSAIGPPVLVVCQPDRPKGRGLALSPPPVKAAAIEMGVQVVQPGKANEPGFVDSIRCLKPDVILVAAYGMILSAEFLAIPAAGCLNVHASLLPKYRGAAPINWAIVNGERITGVSVQKMVRELDAGAILLKKETEIGENENAQELYGRLSLLGAKVAGDTLLLARDGIAAEPQDDARVTRAPMMKKEDGRIDWTLPARDLHNRVRGFYPWPGAYTVFKDKALKLHRTRFSDSGLHAEPGEVACTVADSISVGTGSGILDILELQIEGGKRLSASEFARGHRILAGLRFKV